MGFLSREQAAAGKTVHMQQDFWFLTDPDQFIYFCRAKNAEWQLLKTPWTMEKFVNVPHFSYNYFDSGFKLTSQEAAILRSEKGEQKGKYTLRNTFLDSSSLSLCVSVCLSPSSPSPPPVPAPALSFCLPVSVWSFSFFFCFSFFFFVSFSLSPDMAYEVDWALKANNLLSLSPFVYVFLYVCAFSSSLICSTNFSA